MRRRFPGTKKVALDPSLPQDLGPWNLATLGPSAETPAGPGWSQPGTSGQWGSRAALRPAGMGVPTRSSLSSSSGSSKQRPARWLQCESQKFGRKASVPVRARQGWRGGRGGGEGRGGEGWRGGVGRGGEGVSMQPLLPQVVIQPGEKPGQAPNTMPPRRAPGPGQVGTENWRVKDKFSPIPPG